RRIIHPQRLSRRAYATLLKAPCPEMAVSAPRPVSLGLAGDMPYVVSGTILANFWEKYQTIFPGRAGAHPSKPLQLSRLKPELTPEAAADLVVEHLINRTRSRISRWNSQHKSGQPPQR